MAQSSRGGLGAQRQLGREKAMRLGHGRLGAIENVINELPAVRQFLTLAVDILCARLIDQKQMVGPWPAGEVAVLAYLDVAVGAQNRQPSVAPGRQAVGRKPVDSNVA